MDNPNNSYNNCQLCSRKCGVDRASGELGFCGASSIVRVARAALHFWEEPVISGESGSGAIFFSGCSLKCAYCQNRDISYGGFGKEISDERLAEIMLELEKSGALNINLVTPTHYAPSIVRAVRMARESGLGVPIVYNTSSYDTVQTLRMLEGTVDIYLPDLKYYKDETAKKLSHAPGYRSTALSAIDEMLRQKPKPVVEDGIMKSGVIVRILLLPGHLAEAKLNLKTVLDRYGDRVYVSLMSQYTPIGVQEPPLNRRVTRAEYEELCDYAARLGVCRGFTQDYSSSDEDFVPDFDLTGI